MGNKGPNLPIDNAKPLCAQCQISQNHVSKVTQPCIQIEKQTIGDMHQRTHRSWSETTIDEDRSRRKGTRWMMNGCRRKWRNQLGYKYSNMWQRRTTHPKNAKSKQVTIWWEWWCRQWSKGLVPRKPKPHSQCVAQIHGEKDRTMLSSDS